MSVFKIMPNGHTVRRSTRRSRSDKADRYVKLPHWLMETAAWRSLDTIARCAYTELLKRYRGPGSNNGRLPFSAREMAEKLNVSKATAFRAFRALQHRGFIVEMKRGAFSLKVRHATEWRLTDFGCDVTEEPPTKEFTRWDAGLAPSQKTKHGTSGETVRVTR